MLDQAQVEANAPTPLLAMVRKMSSVLRVALGTRLKTLSVSITADQTRSLHDVDRSEDVPLIIGFHLDPTESLRLADLGPPAEDAAEAAKFRSFWGSKCELRRFKDGKILEAVIWSAETPMSRYSIIGNILAYILIESDHFQFPRDALTLASGQYEQRICESLAIRQGRHYVGDPEVKGFLPVIAAFDALARTTRALDGLPLSISGIAASSDGLRYMSTFICGSRNLTTLGHIPMHDGIIAFEYSGHWPEDLEAIQKIKATMLATLAELLLADESIALAEIAFDLDASPIADNVSMEVLTQSGYGFRLRIHHAHEKVLIDRLLSDPIHQPGPADHSLISAAGRLHHLRFVAAPRHHAALAVVHHRFPSFGATVRVVKRWLSSHLLGPHFSAIWVEMLVASIYLCPGPMDPPTTPSSGFSRVLRLLRNWHWRDEPLLVPIYSVNEDDDVAPVRFPRAKADIARRAFKDHRTSDPAIYRGAMIIATEHDSQGRDWCWDNPGRMVADRMQALAEACLEVLDGGLKINFSVRLSVVLFTRRTSV